MHGNLNRRILVIDDNRAIHEDFRKILAVQTIGTAYEKMSDEFFGEPLQQRRSVVFELESAFQGREGLSKVTQAVTAKRPYCLAFIDVRMPPGWDGIETTARIWEVDPDVQVVICTAFSDYNWDEIARKLGQTARPIHA